MSVGTRGRILVFEVLRDEDAEVWYTSETPIQGVLAEAPTLEELSEKLSIIVPEILEIEKEHERQQPGREQEKLFQTAV